MADKQNKSRIYFFASITSLDLALIAAIKQAKAKTIIMSQHHAYPMRSKIISFQKSVWNCPSKTANCLQMYKCQQIDFIQNTNGLR